LEIEPARRIIQDAIAARIFPAAVVEVGRSTGASWHEAFGALTLEADAPPTSLDTPFDLASLTKPIATATMLMDLVSAGAVRLDDPVRDFFGDWRGADREQVTVRDLLEHASGLAARLVDVPPEGRREFEHDICTMALEYTPRTQSVYSDLGFILLAFLAADRGKAALAQWFDRFFVRLKADATPVVLKADATPDVILTFALPPDVRRRAAATIPMEEDPRRGRSLVGEVHDSYAAVLGGVAGHAGMFGTASGVGVFARAVLRAARGARDLAAPLSPESVALFTATSTVPGSSRALGWDTMLPTSSCGTRMSPAAFGHVGFTGTSLWIDPTRDRYFVLLTNRACSGGSLDDMRTVRRAFHDALADV
jgi:CubicO group peptidase (beta-lactamase class C family)